VTARPGPARLGGLLPAVLERLGVRDQVRRMEVLELWPDIVGEQLAQCTKAKDITGATLFVEVRSSAWLMELNMMREDFLARVNDRVGDVPFERIVFVQGQTEQVGESGSTNHSE
jgi:predicted nucleic acid-binding Zn ribbon protein